VSERDDLEKIYKDIKKRVYARYNKRKEVVIHAASYFMLVIIGAPLLGLYDINVHGWAWRVLGLLWTVGLIGHGIEVWFYEMSQRALDRELERLGLLNKPKRDQLVQIGEDGELEDVLFTDPTEERQSRR
jgi:hypothetical protein